MIEFRFDNLHRILLVTFEAEGTALNFARLDDLLRVFVEQHGTADTIIDFGVTGIGALNTSDIITRASRPSRMPGRRRVFVAASDHVFGMMRLYGAHQEGIGESTPTVVRNLDAALALLGTTLDSFKPVCLDGVAPSPEKPDGAMC